MDNLKVKRNINVFVGERYSSWKLRVRALLSELGAIKVIDEDKPQKEDNEWNKCEHVAKSVIIEYLADSFLCFAKPGDSAKDIFKSLDSIYERKSIATQLALRKKLLGLKLSGDTTLVKHFTVFDDLIAELMAAGAKLDEADKVAHLLLSLPPSYNGVITAIETLSEDNLTLSFVKTRLFDEEVKLLNENRDTSAKVLFAEKKTEYKQNRNFNKLRLTNKYKKQNLKKRQNDQKCFHCGRKGHLIKNCFYYKRNMNNKEKKQSAVQDNQATSYSASTSGIAFMVGNYSKDYQKYGDEISFILDSGATDHIINRDDIYKFSEVLKDTRKIGVAKNDVYIEATKRGTIDVITNTGISLTLLNVLYCPEAPHSILSVSRMIEAGLIVKFKVTGAEVIYGGKMIMKGNACNTLQKIQLKISRKSQCSVAKIHREASGNYKLWHKRLGHIGKSKFLEIKTKKMFNDSERLDNVMPDDNLCESCIYGKQARLPFQRHKNKVHIQRPLYVVHSDVCGPISPQTYDDKNYFAIFIDEYTHYCVSYLIKNKSDVFAIFKDFVSKSEARFNSKLVYLYCDNGGEYLSNEMKEFCVEKGISFHLTVPRTPQLNGVAERMNRTITEKARAMISDSGLDKFFWGEAVLTATYLINISPTKALIQNKTPFELWHGKKPELKNLKVFGATVYVHNKLRQTKFDDRSWKGILVGYEPNGYKVWDMDKRKCVVVRDVIIDETNFKESRPKSGSEKVNSEFNDQRCNDIENRSVESHKSDVVKSDNSQKSDRQKSDGVNVENTEFESVNLDQESKKSVRETDVLDSSLGHKRQASPELRRSCRIKEKPAIAYNEEEIEDYLLCAQSLNLEIPKTYQEMKSSVNRVKWEQAVRDEINSLEINETWTLVQKPEKKNIIECKWVFAIKHDEHGNPIKYKARLVAKGFSQKFMHDYDETFAPVARIGSFRFLLAFANQFKLLIHHMDVKTAFLNGILKEEIYMKVPEGITGKENHVCKLNKAIYGLKQAARCWYELFDRTLKEQGFKSSSVDPCIYVLDKGSVLRNIYIVLYVDDLVIATANAETMNNLKHYLMNRFKMIDLKEIRLFLGIKIERENDTISLDQSAYIRTILNKYKMDECNPVSTPLETKLNYEALNSDEKYNAPCRNVIGSLMYVMLCTRPDISTAVNILSRYLNKNNKVLWQYLKRVLRYLKGTMNLKLTYSRTKFVYILNGYVDSDWGGQDPTDRKSTTGYVFKLFENCTITWNTRKQLSVAASSTEAEYMALFEGVREALWLKSLANSINLIIDEPIVIFEDNSGCISIVNNPTCHKKTKHIDIKYHFSREQVQKKVIKIEYIPTGKQLADMMTKPLPAPQFITLRCGLNLR